MPYPLTITIDQTKDGRYRASYSNPSMDRFDPSIGSIGVITMNPRHRPRAGLILPCRRQPPSGALGVLGRVGVAMAAWAILALTPVVVLFSASILGPSRAGAARLIEADDLAKLMDQSKDVLAPVPIHESAGFGHDVDEDAEDLADAKAAMDDVHENGGIPWKEVEAEMRR